MDVDEELVNEMETLKTMTAFGEDDEQVPKCSLNGKSLKEVLVWTEYHKKWKSMDLNETFNMIISADYLGNEGMLEKMLKKVFLKNSFDVIDEAANKFDDGTIVRLLDNFKRRNEVLVSCHHNKFQYFDPNKNQWITMTRPSSTLPVWLPNVVGFEEKFLEKVDSVTDNQFCSKKKVCAIKDKIYVLGSDMHDNGESYHIAVYSISNDNWRIISNAFMGCYKKFSVDFLRAVGDKLFFRTSHVEQGDDGFLSIHLDDEDPNVMRDVEDLNSNKRYEYGRAGPGIASTDDALYVVGGECDTSVERFDADEDKYEWTTITNMPSARGDTGAAVLDGKLYVSGGQIRAEKTNKYLKIVECYDFATDTWTKLSDMNKGRAGHDLLVINGSLVAVGGDEGDGESIEEYNVAEGIWTVKQENLGQDLDGAFVMMKCFMDQEDGH